MDGIFKYRKTAENIENTKKYWKKYRKLPNIMKNVNNVPRTTWENLKSALVIFRRFLGPFHLSEVRQFENVPPRVNLTRFYFFSVIFRAFRYFSVLFGSSSYFSVLLVSSSCFSAPFGTFQYVLGPFVGTSYSTIFSNGFRY